MKVIRKIKFEHVTGEWISAALVELSTGKLIVDVEGTCKTFVDTFHNMMDDSWVERDPEQAFKSFVFILTTRDYLRVVEYEINDGKKTTHVKAA